MNKTVQNRFQGYEYLPPLNKNSLNQLCSIIEKNEVELVYLAHDDWIYHFRHWKELKEAKIVSSSRHSIEITSFKSKTYSYLDKHIPVPFMFENPKLINDYPIFMKPDRGQGGRGAAIIRNRQEFDTVQFSNENLSHLIFTEFLSGPEYTIDCFSDLNHNVIFASRRLRQRIEGGKAVETVVLDTPKFITEWATLISLKLEIHGAWFFQIKMDHNSSPKLLEVGLRVAGASGVNRLNGVNLSQLNFYQHTEHQPNLRCHVQKNRPKLYKNSFDFGFDYQAIYVDLDDTIITDRGINEDLIRFLYLSRKQEKDIFLITRNQGNLESVIETSKIENLFRNILIVRQNERKSSYINEAIPFLFIDDSFSEREDVKNIHLDNCLVLDPTFYSQGVDFID